MDIEGKLGFGVIRQRLKECCVGEGGRLRVDEMSFVSDLAALQNELAAVSEFQRLITFETNPPSWDYYDISATLNKLRIEGTFPEIGEVDRMRISLNTIKSIVSFFKQKEGAEYPNLKERSKAVTIFPFVVTAIDRILDKHGNIRDNASPQLYQIRSDIRSKNIQATKRLNQILKHAQSEGFVDIDSSISIRNGRGVIPVNASDKKQIKGLVHDRSSTGKTIFIEPEEVVEINNEIVELEYEERREIVRILVNFADSIRPYISDLLLSNSFLGEMDFLRAKATLGNEWDCLVPVIDEFPHIEWQQARHPLLLISFGRTKERKIVPLDISLNEHNRIIVISGPNAGGKSVCLKTVGLLQYMLQCGMTIPVAQGSSTGVFKNILIDIGDEQSIENDLSTYSSHLLNMKTFLRQATSHSLVLIDELGGGTEPMLGGAIAEAILEELNSRGVYGVMTTHYTSLKHFASQTEGVINGAMLYDNSRMQPLFRLDIGKPGSSFAFEIAKKIGLPDKILDSAAQKVGTKNVNYDKALKDIARDKHYWENKRQNIRKQEKRLEELVLQYEEELSQTKQEKKEIICRAKAEAEAMLKESNRLIEKTIREIKEANAEKTKTKEIRATLEEFKKEVDSSDKDDNSAAIDRKIEKIKARAERAAKAKLLSKEESAKGGEEDFSKPLSVGDTICMTDTGVAGEIVEIKENFITAETGSFRFSVKMDRVERISKSDYKKRIKQHVAPQQITEFVNERKMNFRSEIDIRGVRTEEALLQVRDFLDDAMLIQYNMLTILHGKGNGILRKKVRELLSTIDFVADFYDEHPDRGGQGVTVVQLSFDK